MPTFAWIYAFLKFLNEGAIPKHRKRESSLVSVVCVMLFSVSCLSFNSDCGVLVL